MMIAQDTILRLRYKILKQIGKGGIGETYLAEDLDLPIEPKPLCVVKRLQPKAQHSHIIKMFQQEAEKLYKLGNHHQQIPTLFAYFEEEGEFYLVQELIEGCDLSKEINAQNIWSEFQTLDFLQEILPVLQYIHENNLIHRDIKPHNIMRRGQNNQLVLIDFGIVKELTSSEVNTQGETVPTVIAGTPGYMPSEQALGKPKLCSDLYALGMTAIQALTGIKPDGFEENDEGEISWRQHTQVSDDLAAILTKMTRYHFSQRYATASEALEAIKKVNQTTIQDKINPIQDKLKTFVDLKGAHSNQPLVNCLDRDNLSSISSIPTTTFGTPKVLKIGTKYGFINQTGQIVIDPRFENANKFSEGLAGVKIANKWGFIDSTGEMVIRPQFDDTTEFSEGLAKIKIGLYWGYCDRKGNIIIQPNYKEAWNFSQGLAAVKIGTRWGYINSLGQFAIRPQFEDTWYFSEGLARVRKGTKWGYIDLQGNIVIPVNFDYAWYFNQGLACIKLKDSYGFINLKGDIVIHPQFGYATNFYEGLATVKIGNKLGYINTQGQIVIQPEYSNTRKFSEGLAAFCLGNKWGYINTQGEIIINPQFDDTWWFYEGISRVLIANREGYINKLGKLIR